MLRRSSEADILPPGNGAWNVEISLRNQNLINFVTVFTAW